MNGRRTNRKFTNEEADFLIAVRHGKTYEQIAKEFNAKFSPPINRSQVHVFMKYRKLKTGYKGHQWKKGERISVSTEFKKGAKPHNYKPVGSITKAKDGFKIKVAEPKKERYLHCVIWENTHGIIPKDHIIIFADGNNQNLCIDNLLCVSRAEQMMLTKFNLYGKSRELTEAGLLAAKLILKATERKKKQ